MKRAEWELRRARWRRAMQAVAEEVGKGSPIYEAMGSLAWGRHKGESSASENKDHVVFGCGYLEGVRDALLGAGQVGGWTGTNLLRRIHDRLVAMERKEHRG